MLRNSLINKIVVATFFMTVFGVTTTATAEPPNRSGFTLELGLGPGLTVVAPDDFDSQTNVGLAGLSISLGGFLNERLAIEARITGTSFSETAVFQGDIAFTQTVVNGLLGVTAQYFVTDDFYVAGGPGLGVLSFTSGTGGPDPEAKTGFAFNARTGYSFWNNADHRLGVALEVSPMLFDGFKTMSAGLQLEWQLL